MLSNQWNDSKLHNYIRLQGEWTAHKTRLQGKGPHWLGKGRMRMYSSRLVGVIVMTSSTFWPLVTEVLTHKWAFNPVRVQLSYTQIDMNLPVSFSPSSFLIPRPPRLVAQLHPSASCHSRQLHTLDCLWSEWDRGRSSWLVAFSSLQGLCLKWASTVMTHTHKKVKWYRTRENCVGQSVWFDFKYVSHLIHADPGNKVRGTLWTFLREQISINNRRFSPQHIMCTLIA